MGNTESNASDGVKKQAGVSLQPLYKLVNLNGGGLLVDMMKRACQNKQYAEIDHAIKTKVSSPFGFGSLKLLEQFRRLRDHFLGERSR